MFVFNQEEANELLTKVTTLAEETGDELMADLSELLTEQLAREARYREHLIAQGLPEGITLERFIKHHRNNAKLSGAFQAYKEIVADYEPTPEELVAVVHEVYGPGKPESWQLENAKAALLKANKFRAERF